MCTNRVLWLLSYIGLSVALALGNRQSTILEHQQNQQQQHQTRQPMHDWLLYEEKPAGPMLEHDRLVLLDDVLANMLDDLQQRGEHTMSKSQQSQPPKSRLAPLEATEPRPRRSEAVAFNQITPIDDPSASKRRISAARRQQMSQQDPQEAAQALAQAGSSMAASSFMFNSRNDRSYDVPLIECPMSEDGMERFACPTSDRMGRYHCIDDHVLCDGYIDCPLGEDEDMQACMFYRTTKAHIDILADALLRWARGR